VVDVIAFLASVVTFTQIHCRSTQIQLINKKVVGILSGDALEQRDNEILYRGVRQTLFERRIRESSLFTLRRSINVRLGL
jgi:hypothetical protein